MYVEPDSFDGKPELQKLRDKALGLFAKSLSGEVEMPLEEPFEVAWTDHEGQRNAFFIGVDKPNYAGRRAWILCINSGSKIQKEALDYHLRGAPIKTRELVAGGTLPSQSRDWSRWRVIMTAGEGELSDCAHWMGLLAKARMTGGSIPPPPKCLPQQDIRRILQDEFSTDLWTREGHSAMLKDDPYAP